MMPVHPDRPLVFVGFVVFLAFALAGAKAAEVAEAEDTTAVRGRVTDEAGQPIAGARVRLLRRGLAAHTREMRPDGWSDPVVVTADDDGTFTAADAGASEFTVRAEAPGCEPTVVDGIPAGAWLSLHLRAGHGLAGRVVDDVSGEALPAAVVVACDAEAWPFGRDACATVASDEQGDFTLDGLPAGRVEVRAAAADHAVSAVRPFVLPLAGTADGPVVFRLRPGARVSGRVVDEADRPLAAVRVLAGPLTNALDEREAENEGWPSHSAGDGSFVFDGLPAGRRFGLFAYRKDRGVSGGPSLEIVAGENLSDIEIRLPAAAEVRLQLVDEVGGAIESFEIFYRASGETAAEFLGPLEATRIERGPEGRSLARIVESGSFDLRIRPEGCETIEVGEVALAPGTPTDLGTLVGISGHAVRGRVTDGAGDPIAHATVEADWPTDGGLGKRRALADAEGRYVLIGLGELPVRIRVTAAGFVAASFDGILPPADGVNLTLRPTGGVAGTVAFEEGGVPPGFMVVVHLEASSEESAPAEGGEFPRKESFAGEDGRFRVDDLPPGNFTVEARAPGRAPARESDVRVEHGEITELEPLELAEGLALEGRVVAEADDAPVVGATIRARREGGSLVAPMPMQQQSAGSDEEGRFRLEGLEPGAHELSAAHPDFASAKVRVELDEDDRADEVELRLSAGGTLSGTVRGAEGLLAAGRRIVATKDFTDTSGWQSATTDSEGRYLLERLAPGAYVVSAMPEAGVDFRSRMKNATIREGELTVVDFDEAPAITLSGHVYRNGEPLEHVQLFFARSISLTEFKYARSDASAWYEVGLDEPGRYRVLLQTGAGGAGGASTEITVPDLEQVQQDIHLGGDGIAGHVLDSDDRPIAGAVVSAAGDAGTAMTDTAFLVAESANDGSYSIQGLGVGVYRLTAIAPGYQAGVAYPVELPEGAGVVGVDFRLERGGTLTGRLVDGVGHGIPGAAVLAAPAGTQDPWGTSAATALTDVNGSFRMTLPADGALDITALPGGWAPLHLQGVAPPADGEDLVLRAGRGGTLRIQVVDAEERPLAGVLVAARPTPSFLGSEMGTLLSPPVPTDGTGMTTIPLLAPGMYTIVVGGQDEIRPTTLVSDEAETLLRVELP